MVSGLTYKSLIHFKFIFVLGVREWSSLILLRVAVQFSQHHLLKRLSFCIVYFCLLCHKLIDHMWVYFWVQYSVPLIYVSIFMSMLYCFDYYSFVIEFEIREHDASSFIRLSQYCFGYLGSFMVLYNFKIICSIFVKNAIGILIGIALNLQIALGSMDILTVLILQSMSMAYLSNYLCHFQFPSSMFYSLQSIGLSCPWLSLFLAILFILMRL